MQYKIKAMLAKCYHNTSMMLVKWNTNANKQYYNAGTVIGQCQQNSNAMLSPVKYSENNTSDIYCVCLLKVHIFYNMDEIQPIFFEILILYLDHRVRNLDKNRICTSKFEKVRSNVIQKLKLKGICFFSKNISICYHYFKIDKQTNDKNNYLKKFCFICNKVHQCFLI